MKTVNVSCVVLGQNDETSITFRAFVSNRLPDCAEMVSGKTAMPHRYTLMHRHKCETFKFYIMQIVFPVDKIRISCYFVALISNRPLCLYNNGNDTQLASRALFGLKLHSLFMRVLVCKWFFSSAVC